MNDESISSDSIGVMQPLWLNDDAERDRLAVSAAVTSQRSDRKARHNIYFVGTGPGKMSDDFLAIASPVFRRYQINALRYKQIQQFSDAIDRGAIEGALPCTVVMIYHEENEVNNSGAALEQLCQTKLTQCRLIHPVSLARIIGDKILTNRTLSKAGVRCPKLIETACHDKPVFQNAPSASQHPVSLILPGEPLNPHMYNTEFIDTRYRFDDETYFCSIRALCVGGIPSSLFLRFRNVKEQNFSVHTKNTPLLPELINHYYYRKLLPVSGTLFEMCRKVGEVFGLGFYVHDMALCARTNQLYFLESGLKFHENTWADHLQGIADKLVLNCSGPVIVIKMIYEFIRQIETVQKWS